MSELQELKEKTERLKNDHQRSELKLEQAYEGLKRDFGLKTVEEVENRILELDKEVEKSKIKKERLVSRAKKKLEKYES